MIVPGFGRMVTARTYTSISSGPTERSIATPRRESTRSKTSHVSVPITMERNRIAKSVERVLELSFTNLIVSASLGGVNRAIATERAC